ncbi:AraC family transcriptional regulator [Ruegeria pomeroyi]|uniref:AraC family transcriptional regulator n=1 Tax=Ruegeria pomeroyi TaxID=89184 RepID=A0A9Q3WRT6_9RHOB|nr:AraC family transcriptional regulator [Ruegeria pomeroyi]
MKAEMTQRAGVLSELPAILREHGVNVASVFDGSGIDPTALSPGTRVPFDALLSLLHKASQATSCPHLGLLVGLRFTFEIHGAIGQLMLSASNVREAFGDFVTWQPGYSSGAIVYLNRFGDEYAIGYGSYAASAPGSRVLYDAIIGVGVQMLRLLTKGAVKPVEVHFSHRRPQNPAEYSRLLNLPIRYNEHRTCLIIDAEGMLSPLPSADLEARRILLAEVKRTRSETAQDMSTRTRHALRDILQVGKPTLSGVASEMGIHPRTLERRLTEEGQTFGALRDEVRFLVARELLELTDIPVGEIGALLAFASPSVFADSFRRISCTSPSAWRARAPEIWALT